MTASARAAALFIVLAAAAVAAGCTAQEPPDTGNCVLNIATGVDVSGGVRQRVLDRLWNDHHHEMRACLRPISPVADQVHSEMISSAQAESTVYDVYNLDIQEIPEFAEGGYVAPLDVSMHERVDEDAIFPRVWRAGSWEGVQYAAPFNTDAALLYYRSDRVGVIPTTWQQLADGVRTYGTAPDVRTGLAGQYAQYEGLTVNAMEAVWAAGGEWVTAEGRVSIDSPRGHDGLDLLLRAVRPREPGATAPPLIPRHLLGHYEDDSLAEFGNRRALFMRNWPYAQEVLSGEEDPVPFEVAPLPWPSVLGGQYLAVASTSRHPEHAQALVAALTGERAAAELYRCGGFAPARVSAFASPPCRDRRSGESPPGWEDSPVPSTADTALQKALADARPRPATPYYSQFSEVLQGELHRLLRCHASDAGGCKDAATFARRVVPRLQRALEGRVPS